MIIHPFCFVFFLTQNIRELPCGLLVLSSTVEPKNCSAYNYQWKKSCSGSSVCSDGSWNLEHDMVHLHCYADLHCNGTQIDSKARVHRSICPLPLRLETCHVFDAVCHRPAIMEIWKCLRCSFPLISLPQKELNHLFSQLL